MNLKACPICGKSMPGPWQEYPAYPFCSSRCRLIDLGRWLNEDYKFTRPPDDPQAVPPTDDSSTADQ